LALIVRIKIRELGRARATAIIELYFIAIDTISQSGDSRNKYRKTFFVETFAFSRLFR
jgi:hypothetical protein